MPDDVVPTYGVASRQKGIEISLGMSVQFSTVLPYGSVVRYSLRLRINLCIDEYYHNLIIDIAATMLAFLSHESLFAIHDIFDGRS